MLVLGLRLAPPRPCHTSWFTKCMWLWLGFEFGYRELWLWFGLWLGSGSQPSPAMCHDRVCRNICQNQGWWVPRGVVGALGRTCLLEQWGEG